MCWHSYGYRLCTITSQLVLILNTVNPERIASVIFNDFINPATLTSLYNNDFSRVLHAHAHNVAH